MSNVIQFGGRADYTDENREIVRSLCIAECRREGADQGVASICIMITSEGEIRSRIANVEPEYIAPLIAEHQKMIRDLEDFARRIEAKKASVIGLL